MEGYTVSLLGIVNFLKQHWRQTTHVAKTLSTVITTTKKKTMILNILETINNLYSNCYVKVHSQPTLQDICRAKKVPI